MNFYNIQHFIESNTSSDSYSVVRETTYSLGFCSFFKFTFLRRKIVKHCLNIDDALMELIKLIN